MRLVGNYLSPYVRRVAVSLDLLGLPFDLEQLYVFKSPETVKALNPVVRIPVLILDDGTKLIESAAILDEIDQKVPVEQRLVPPDGELRRRVVQTTSLALACAEKAQWAFYERRVRPEEKVHEPWIEHNQRQVIGGFAALEEQLQGRGSSDWIEATGRISQADVTTTVAFTFADVVLPGLGLRERFPDLADLVARNEATDAFAAAPVPKPG